jgi:hypothetical protein
MAGKRKALAALEAHASHNPQLVAVAGGTAGPQPESSVRPSLRPTQEVRRGGAVPSIGWTSTASSCGATSRRRGGAGLAALFAETARYYNTVATGTQDFGLHAAFFIGLAVIAYVFKDRLKDLSKDYLGRRVARRIPDRVSMLVLPHIGATNQLARVAVCHHEEAVRRLDVTGLPAEVVYVWERGAEPIPRAGPPCPALRKAGVAEPLRARDPRSRRARREGHRAPSTSAPSCPTSTTPSRRWRCSTRRRVRS